MNPLFCSVCKLQLDSAANWSAHVLGKAHLSRLTCVATTTAECFCRPCNKQCDSLFNYQQHCKSKAHVQRAGPIPAAAPAPVITFDFSDDEDDFEYSRLAVSKSVAVRPPQVAPKRAAPS